MPVCIEPGCPEFSNPPSPRCEQHTRVTRAAKRKQYPRRTYGTEWPSIRKAQLRRQPTCPCGAPATVVDHIIPVHHHPNRQAAHHPTNLQSMCAPCHNRKTATIDSRFGRPPVQP